ncbi:MAG: hypothetical protein V2A61_04260 [Calditrichota bacterium]
MDGKCIIAVYFAVEENDNTKKNHLSENVRRLFIYDTERETLEFTDLFANRLPTIHKFPPPHVHPRIVHQSSIFTVHPKPYEDLISLVRTEPKYSKDELKILNIPEFFVSDIQRALNRLGINSSNIWPDLSGVAKYVKWRLIHETD